jgi:hypothetical protein
MCTQRGISSCDGILKHKLKVRLSIERAKPLNQASEYTHYNKTNMYVTGTKAKPLDFRLT